MDYAQETNMLDDPTERSARAAGGEPAVVAFRVWPPVALGIPRAIGSVLTSREP